MDRQSDSIFDEERLRRLIELMKEHDLRELELRASEQHVRLTRGGPELPAGAIPMMAAAHYPAPAYNMPPQAAPSGHPFEPPQAASPQVEPDGDNIILIRSPMVGTFYTRPNPKAPPYVKVGEHVEPETTICIIEAMKVFNEIPAEVRGKIIASLVDDEEPVEFGKPLFKVDTQG